MVRVAGLFEQLDAGIDARGPDGLAPAEQIDAIQARVLELDRRLHRCFEQGLRPGLEGHGIRIVGLESASGGRAPRDRHALPRAGVPRPDAAGDRPGAAIPLHLQPLAEPWRAAARPRERWRDHRPRQGAEGAARPLPAARARRERRSCRWRRRSPPTSTRSSPAPRLSITGTSGSRATPTSPSPTRRTTCSRRSRTRFAGAASARSCGWRWRPA